MKPRAPGALVALGLLLGGCGLKGPLYLPEKPGEVVIRPAPTAAAPATPGAPATPPVPAEPEQPQVPPTGPDRG